MLRVDLAKYFKPKRVFRKPVNILKASRTSRSNNPTTSSNSSPRESAQKQFRIDEDTNEVENLNQQVPLISELYLSGEHQLDRIVLEQNLPDLTNEKLPEMIPYPPQAFFTFPTMP